MSQITPEQEEEIRTEIGSVIQSVDTAGAVFSDVRKFETKEELYKVLKQFGYNATNPHIRFVQIIWIGYRREDKDLFLRYRINIFQEYFPATLTAPGSTAVFNAFIINLKNTLKASRDITASGDLFNDDDLELFLDDKNEFYKGSYGHRADPIIEVEVIDC